MVTEEFLNEIKCCLNDDGHYVNEPILMKCGANACKNCINESHNEVLECKKCNGQHNKSDYVNAVINKFVQNFQNANLNAIVEDIKTRLAFVKDSLKGFLISSLEAPSFSLILLFFEKRK